MKNLNKKYLIAALIGVGSLGVHMSTMAQSNTYENQRNTAGYSESDSNTYRQVEHRGDETRNYNMENTHEVSIHQRKMNDLEHARKNGLLTFDETYPQNYFDYQKRHHMKVSEGLTHEQKMNDLEHARKNGLLTFDETYPQNYFDYQKRQMSGNRYNNR